MQDTSNDFKWDYVMDFKYFKFNFLRFNAYDVQHKSMNEVLRVKLQEKISLKQKCQWTTWFSNKSDSKPVNQWDKQLPIDYPITRFVQWLNNLNETSDLKQQQWKARSTSLSRDLICKLEIKWGNEECSKNIWSDFIN